MVGWGIREWIKEAMHHVTSADTAYHWLREQGLPYTRAEVRAAWREVGEKEYWATVLDTWGWERKPHRAWIVEGPSGMRTEYQALVRYDIITPEGVYETRYATVNLHKLESFENVLEKIIDDIDDYVEAEGAKLVRIAPGGFRRRGR